MAFDTIKTGLKVFTNSRRFQINGQMSGPVGGVEGVISSVIRHPLSRHILAVIVDTGSTDPEDRVVVNPRNLRQARTA